MFKELLLFGAINLGLHLASGVAGLVILHIKKII